MDARLKSFCSSTRASADGRGRGVSKGIKPEDPLGTALPVRSAPVSRR